MAMKSTCQASRPLREGREFWALALQLQHVSALPKHPVCIAINYCLNQWESLNVFTRDPKIKAFGFKPRYNHTYLIARDYSHPEAVDVVHRADTFANPSASRHTS